VTAALWTGVRAWMLGAALYVPEEWLTPEARQRARIPKTVRFQEKWRLALTLLRQIRAAGFDVSAVLGDAEFGDNATLRRSLHRLKLPYALGVSSNLTVFRGTPKVAVPPRNPGRSRPPTRLQLTDNAQPEGGRSPPHCRRARGDA
jgi:SRSO17 transposase